MGCNVNVKSTFDAPIKVPFISSQLIILRKNRVSSFFFYTSVDNFRECFNHHLLG